MTGACAGACCSLKRNKSCFSLRSNKHPHKHRSQNSIIYNTFCSLAGACAVNNMSLAAIARRMSRQCCKEYYFWICEREGDHWRAPWVGGSRRLPLLAVPWRSTSACVFSLPSALASLLPSSLALSPSPTSLSPSLSFSLWRPPLIRFRPKILNHLGQYYSEMFARYGSLVQIWFFRWFELVHDMLLCLCSVGCYL